MKNTPNFCSLTANTSKEVFAIWLREEGEEEGKREIQMRNTKNISIDRTMVVAQSGIDRETWSSHWWYYVTLSHSTAYCKHSLGRNVEEHKWAEDGERTGVTALLSKDVN